MSHYKNVLIGVKSRQQKAVFLHPLFTQIGTRTTSYVEVKFFKYNKWARGAAICGHV